jgi:DNA-binding NarL/FixJ family response regulator
VKRLLIIGSREFILLSMDFAADYAPGLSVLGLVDSSTDVVEDVGRMRPDIIVLDGVTNLARAISCLPDLRTGAPNARLVVVVDQPEHDDVARALDAGAVLCVQPAEMRTRTRDPRPETARAQLRSVTGLGEGGDKPALTRREREIMQWVASGHTNSRIARGLWVTEQTIKFHLTNIYRKLGVANRTEASHYVIQHELVARPGAQEPAGVEVRPATLEPVADAPVING